MGRLTLPTSGMIYVDVLAMKDRNSIFNVMSLRE